MSNITIQNTLLDALAMMPSEAFIASRLSTLHIEQVYNNGTISNKLVDDLKEAGVNLSLNTNEGCSLLSACILFRKYDTLDHLVAIGAVWQEMEHPLGVLVDVYNNEANVNTSITLADVDRMRHYIESYDSNGFCGVTGEIPQYYLNRFINSPLWKTIQSNDVLIKMQFRLFRYIKLSIATEEYPEEYSDIVVSSEPWSITKVININKSNERTIISDLDIQFPSGAIVYDILATLEAEFKGSLCYVHSIEHSGSGSGSEYVLLVRNYCE